MLVGKESTEINHKSQFQRKIKKSSDDKNNYSNTKNADVKGKLRSRISSYSQKTAHKLFFKSLNQKHIPGFSHQECIRSKEMEGKVITKGRLQQVFIFPHSLFTVCPLTMNLHSWFPLLSLMVCVSFLCLEYSLLPF